MREIIPVFFAVNDNYAPYLGVALDSMLDNASRDYQYKIYVLVTDLSLAHKEKLLQVAKKYSDFSSLDFVNVNDELEKMKDKLHIRDYYSLETYYRFFIAALFPSYDKVLYLDCDIIVKGDISQMYNAPLEKNLIGAAIEEVVFLEDVFRNYSEKCLGVAADDYIGAGILVINTKAFREEAVEEKFVDLLSKYKFYVAQDQDYLNVICKNRIYYLDLGWNKTAFKNPDFNDANLKIIHYKMAWKPWLNDGVEYESDFWQYAEKNPFFDEILKIKKSYTDQERERDAQGGLRLRQVALRDAENPDNYWNTVRKSFLSYKIFSALKAFADFIFKFPPLALIKKFYTKAVYGSREN